MTADMLAFVAVAPQHTVSVLDVSPFIAMPWPFMPGSPSVHSALHAINPWVGIALELVVLVLLMGALRLYQRFGSLAPETARKLFHIGGGLTTLTFPWIFAQPWPVIVLTAVTIPTLLALKYVSVLKAGLGAVLYS